MLAYCHSSGGNFIFTPGVNGFILTLSIAGSPHSTTVGQNNTTVQAAAVAETIYSYSQCEGNHERRYHNL